MNNFSIINNINYNKINNNHLLLIKEHSFNIKIKNDIFYKIENNNLNIKISKNFKNKFSNIYLYKIEFNNNNLGFPVKGYMNTSDGIIIDIKTININDVISLSDNWQVLSKNFNDNIIIKNFFWISSNVDDLNQNLSKKNIYEINSINNIILKLSNEFKIDSKVKINDNYYLPLKVYIKDYKLIGLNINLPSNIYINLEFNSANQYITNNQIYETWIKKYTINNFEDNNFNAYSTINKGLNGNDNWQTILYLNEYQDTKNNYNLDSNQLKDIKYNMTSLNEHLNILLSQYNIKKDLITNNCNEILNYINNSIGISLSNTIINENDILTKVMKIIVFLINTIKINDNNVLLPLLNTIINGEVTYNNGIYYVNGRQITINDTYIITDSNIYTNNLNSILNNWNTNSLDDLNLLVSNWNT